MADWSNLAPELIFCVAKHMDSLEEYIVLGAVCKSWRSVATKENYFICSELRLRHQVPLLVLPRDKGATTRRRKYHSLTKRKICELDLSEIEGELCLSSLGWLLTLSKDYKFSLIHPLSHARIEVPHGRPNMSPLFRDALRKFVLSSSPSWTGNYTVMAMGYGSLAFCRPGLNEKWARIIALKKPVIFSDLAYYKGQLHVVDTRARVYQLCYTHTENPNPTQAELRVVAPEFPRQLLGPSPSPTMEIKMTYLVESAGALLVVICFCFYNPRKCEPTAFCRVFKLPFSSGNGNLWLDSEVNNLGNTSLFLCAKSSSFSVEASETSPWKANCIYFMNNKTVSPTVGMDMGIFNMDDRQIEWPPFDKSFRVCYKGRYFETSHMWIEPSF